ncbi:hypothetical protein ACIBO5_41890 [Nonomuraea angiospora]|uniref:hypothetical protein n=1 Tax=Nonomuraea angiospora TaxID=46172 RepID=UPI00379FB3D3
MRPLVTFTGRLGNLTILERTVNGRPGLIVQQDGAIVDDRIKRIWAVRNPDKLRPWTTGPQR